MKALIAEQYERAKRMLLHYKVGHHQLANLLVEREVIFAEDAEKIFGKRPWASRSEEILEPSEPAITNESIETPKSAETGNSTENPKDAENVEPLESSKLAEVEEAVEAPAVQDSPTEAPAMTEAPDYSQPAKPKSERPRKRKAEGLFEGFDFDQDNNEK